MDTQQKFDTTFTVFVVSRADHAALSALSDFSKDLAELRAFAIVTPEDNDQRGKDVATRLCEGYSLLETQLFSWLTTNRPETSAVRLALVQSNRLARGSSDALNETLRWLQELSNTYAPNVTVKAMRVGAFAEEDITEIKNLFIDGSVLNLVVVPRDSQSHDGIAQPVIATNGDLLKSHIQIELATLFGLWPEMRSAIVDELLKVPGTSNQVWLQFVSSRALILECPPLPIAKVIDSDGNLATPVDCEPFPNPGERVGALVRAVYPDELRFESTDEPTGLVPRDARGFWREYWSEFGHAIVRLPRLLVKDLQGDLNSLSSSILQEAVGGSNSHIRILFAEDPTSGDLPAIDDAKVEAMIERLIAEDESPRRLSLEGKHWFELIRKSLGLIDGSTVASLDRQRLGQENWLIVEKSVIGPTADAIGDVLAEFGEFVDPDSHGAAPINHQIEDSTTDEKDWSPQATDQDGDVKIESDDGINVEAAKPEIEEPTSVLAEPEIADSAGGSHKTAPSSLGSEAVASNNQVESVPPRSWPTRIRHEILESKNREPDSVLTGIASEFISEATKARRQANSMIERLRRLPSEFSPREANAISSTIRVALFLGLLVGYFVTGTLTDRRYWLSGEPLTSFTRDFIWTFAATLIVCAAVVGLLVKTSGRWQARVIVAVTFCSVVIAVEWVFFAPIRDFVLEIRPVGRTAVVGALVMASTVAIAVMSYVRNRLSKNRVRRRFAQVLLAMLAVYCVIGITAYLGNSRSPVRELSDQLQLRLAIVGYVLAGSLLFGSAAVFAFVLLREKYRLNVLVDVLRWAERELFESASAERILRRAAIQWVGSAAVLARLAQYPLGRRVHNRHGDSAVATNIDARLMKFAKGFLALTERGQHGLASTLRRLFIRRGWLTTQYLQLVKAFQKEWAFGKGLPEDDGLRVDPETCPVVPMWSEVVDGEARGSRWVFMQSVFAGTFDESLLVRSGDIKLEEAYRTILSDASSHTIGNRVETDAVTFLGRLIPPNGSKMLDGGLVNTVFAGNDPKQRMKTHLWWPEDLLAFERTNANALALSSVRPSEVLTSDRVSSTVRLFGACVSVSEMFLTTEASRQENAG